MQGYFLYLFVLFLENTSLSALVEYKLKITFPNNKIKIFFKLLLIYPAFAY